MSVDSIKVMCAQKSITTDINKLRRIKHLKRLQLFDYRNNSDYNLYEEILANMDVSKRQLDIVTQQLFPKYREVDI